MRVQVADQDFWPGYLDALINVVLYLLIVVGAFALGMVSLTLHSMEQQQQLSFLGGRSSALLQQMDLTPLERARVSERVGQLDIASVVRRKAELDLERQYEELRQTQQRKKVAQQAALSTENNSSKNPDELLPREDLNRQLAAAENEYRNLMAILEKERRQLLLAREASSQQPSAAVVDMRVALTTAEPAVQSSSKELASRLFPKEVKASWEFSPDQFGWASGRPSPVVFSDQDRSSAWRLVIFQDADNSRMRRESFARAISVREFMVKQGFAREVIKVEVRPMQQADLKDERLYRTVFMLQDM